MTNPAPEVDRLAPFLEEAQAVLEQVGLPVEEVASKPAVEARSVGTFEP